MKKRPGTKLVDNWKVVMLSLIGATTFWFFNALNKEYNAVVSYPIQFDMNKDSVVIMESLPEVVDVDISGGGWGLFRNTLWFGVEPIPVQLDNPTDIRFLTQSTLLPIIKDHLSDLTINFLYSDTLYIEIEKKKVKRVRLAVDSTNLNLKVNHRIISQIDIQPKEVDIIGPESIINSLQTQYFVMIDENNIDEDISETITIPLPFEGIMSASPRTADVSFKVDRFDSKKMDLVVEKLNFPTDSLFHLEDSVVSIDYIIRRGLDRSFAASDFSVSVDFNMLEIPDSVIQPLIIYHPEEIENLRLTPSKIKVIRD
ncbi:MAG: hypothetical protein ACI8QD_000102 [Cyclobacteriaceae bacterium]|jgi:hypothetical protein